jgi:hypothetical protein
VRALLAAALCLAGCGPSFPAKPGQDRALAIAWNQTFAADAPPPPIDWREDSCDGGTATAVVEDGHCYAGLFSDGVAHVAWRGSFHASAFAHELMHALQGDHGIIDPMHLRIADWNTVGEANQRLAAAGF